MKYRKNQSASFIKSNLLVFLAIFIFSFEAGISQGQEKLKINGWVQDTSLRIPLRGATVLAVRMKDSVLVRYTRTDSAGKFIIEGMPLDTYQIEIIHPRFASRIFILIGSAQSYDFELGKITLPPVSMQLKEVTIYAFKSPVYFRGDTLVYTADSFKVKPNATVEDLLKRLPGIKVDASGNITSQGTAITQILVDGDEFFGSDPTVATRNLNATSVASVQVYDKKSDNPGGGNTGDDMVKVMNIQLKEDAKNGYFGKAEASGGAPDLSGQKTFYETDLLANKFDNKRKVSVFGLAGNTPQISLGRTDLYQYGLSNDMNLSPSSNIVSGGGSQGIPQTLKAGTYFSDKLSNKTKILFNYTINKSQLLTTSTSRQQYFLADTNYTTTNSSYNLQQGQNHVFNLEWQQKIDSLTTLEVTPRVIVGSSSGGHLETNQFIAENQAVTRQNSIQNNGKGLSLEGSLQTTLKKKYRKADRYLFIDNVADLSNASGTGYLQNINQQFVNSVPPLANINQQKVNLTQNFSNNLSISYTDPLSKKFKLEFMGDLIISKGTQQKNTFDYVNGGYLFKDSLYSNDFTFTRVTSRGGLKLIYDVKKQRVSIGARARNVVMDNLNQVTQQSLQQNVTNILPFLSWRYKLGENKDFRFDYFTGSGLPSINQLQPVPNNANPNYITLGNPALLPSYQHQFQTRYNSFRPITGNNIWAGLSGGLTNNDFSSSVTYDKIGRTITQAVNVNGNYNADASAGYNLSLLSKKLILNPNLNMDYYNTINYINGIKNTTTNASGTGELQITVQTNSLTVNVSGSYSYTDPRSTLNNQSNKPYGTENYNADFYWQMPRRIILSMDGNYTINTQRTVGYNISYFIWNASIGRSFLKNENLILSLVGNDLLNQNISAGRTVQNNVITDSKTAIIKRYIMLSLLWKFNSTKKKEEDDL